MQKFMIPGIQFSRPVLRYTLYGCISQGYRSKVGDAPREAGGGRYFKHHMGCSPGEYRQSTKLQAKHDVEKAT